MRNMWHDKELTLLIELVGEYGKNFRYIHQEFLPKHSVESIRRKYFLMGLHQKQVERIYRRELPEHLQTRSEPFELPFNKLIRRQETSSDSSDNGEQDP